MTRTTLDSAPHFAPAMCCCATSCASASRPCRKARTPTRWCRTRAWPRSSRRSRTRSMCSSARSRSWSAKASLEACREDEERWTGYYRRSDRLRTRSHAISTSRVKDAVDSEEFEFEPYRLVFDSLADDAPDRLDETAARTYEALQAEGLGADQPDVVFERSVNRLEARRLDREIERINRAIPFASDDEKANLAHEKQRLAAERNAKRPTYGIIQSARRKGAPGS